MNNLQISNYFKKVKIRVKAPIFILLLVIFGVGFLAYFIFLLLFLISYFDYKEIIIPTCCFAFYTYFFILFLIYILIGIKKSFKSKLLPYLYFLFLFKYNKLNLLKKVEISKEKPLSISISDSSELLYLIN